MLRVQKRVWTMIKRGAVELVHHDDEDVGPGQPLICHNVVHP